MRRNRPEGCARGEARSRPRGLALTIQARRFGGWAAWRRSDPVIARPPQEPEWRDRCFSETSPRIGKINFKTLPGRPVWDIGIFSGLSRGNQIASVIQLLRPPR